MKIQCLPKQTLACGLDLSTPHIMGILNVTPDSFSDGGNYLDTNNAVKHALQMIEDGATIIDIGGESTRPGASNVDVEEELERVIPVVKELAKCNVKLSIDTSEPEVIKQAVQAGAHIWNDVRALSRPKALETASTLGVPVIMMHMRGEPTTMNDLAHYNNVVGDVLFELQKRIKIALEAGIKKENIILDPGFGFAKDTQHNVELLDGLWHFKQLGYPILAGLSRKRFIGAITQHEDRVIGSVVGHLLCVQQGASIVRTHDVKAMSDALKVWKVMK